MHSAIGTTCDLCSAAGLVVEPSPRKLFRIVRNSAFFTHGIANAKGTNRELSEQNKIRPGAVARVVRAALSAPCTLALAWNSAGIRALKTTIIKPNP